MAAETPISSFNMGAAGESAKRDALSLWYNNRVSHDGTTAGTLAAPVWELIGYKVTSADVSIEYTTDETTHDILGNTHTVLAGANQSIELSDWDVVQGNHLQVDVENALRYDGLGYLESGGDFCLVHHYAGSSGAYLAERWSGCGIKPGRRGGDGGGNLTMDVTITLAGAKSIGTAAISGGSLTFTETEAPAWPGTIS